MTSGAFSRDVLSPPWWRTSCHTGSRQRGELPRRPSSPPRPPRDEDSLHGRTGKFLLPRGSLLTIVNLLLVSPEVVSMSEGLLAGLTDEQSDILVDGTDVPVKVSLPSKEFATIRTLEGQPLLVDLLAMAEHFRVEAERLVALGTNHFLLLVLLDSSLGLGARGCWYRLGLAPVHLALNLAGELPTVTAQVLIKVLESREGGVAVLTR